jgi:deoxyadenosine/deoxycytidine kinase
MSFEQFTLLLRVYYAGKTTLVTKIAEDFNAKTVLERFADNPFA